MPDEYYTHYEILKIAESATDKEIKEARGFLSHAWHPDKFQDEQHKKLATEILRQINDAYEVLSNPDKRREYDDLLMDYREEEQKSASYNNQPDSRPTSSSFPQLYVNKRPFEFLNIRKNSHVSDSFTISNVGGGVLSGPIKTNKKWLKVSQNNIDTTKHKQDIAFHVDTSGLSFGFRDTGTIEIQSNGGAERVNVTLSIEPNIVARKRRNKYIGLGVGLSVIIYIIVTSTVGSVGKKNAKPVDGTYAWHLNNAQMSKEGHPPRSGGPLGLVVTKDKDDEYNFTILGTNGRNVNFLGKRTDDSIEGYWIASDNNRNRGRIEVKKVSGKKNLWKGTCTDSLYPEGVMIELEFYTQPKVTKVETSDKQMSDKLRRKLESILGSQSKLEQSTTKRAKLTKAMQKTPAFQIKHKRKNYPNSKMYSTVDDAKVKFLGNDSLEIRIKVDRVTINCTWSPKDYAYVGTWRRDTLERGLVSKLLLEKRHDDRRMQGEIKLFPRFNSNNEIMCFYGYIMSYNAYIGLIHTWSYGNDYLGTPIKIAPTFWCLCPDTEGD